MLDFTGERVVPGRVDPDLWAEHLARYSFALPFTGPRHLDLACGTGYGSWLLASRAQSVLAVDLDPAAIAYAERRFVAPNLLYRAASVLDTGLPDHSFDSITAFEILEHLAEPASLIAECARLLTHHGVLILSTPNRDFYQLTRSEPNPFHLHELSLTEFRAALTQAFPHVLLFEQNHHAAQVISPLQPAPLLATAPQPSPQPHYLLALASRSPLPAASGFAWFPGNANLLATKTQHITKLTSELDAKSAWLQREIAEKQNLQDLFAQHQASAQADSARLNAELAKANAWAQQLDLELAQARTRLAEQYDEFTQQVHEYELKVAALEDELSARLAWVQRVQSELDDKSNDLLATLARADHAESALAEQIAQRTHWEVRAHELFQQLAFVRASRWVRLGNTLGIGPRIPDEETR